jgi:hypothetical protein
MASVPPHKLVSELWNREDIILHGAGKPERISATRAMALAEKGLIEGVRRGRLVKFVRWLRASAQPDRLISHPQQPATDDGLYQSRSTAFARTNLGVYRQPMREAIVTDDFISGRKVTAEGEITGYCFSHCATRRLDNPKPKIAPAPVEA